MARILIWIFIALSVLPLACANKDNTDDADSRPPNIVFILVDDLGIGDVGAYGGKVIDTPHIDNLAQSGVRFTQGYVTHPTCSPSRAGLITGRYQQRHGWEFNPGGRDQQAGMSLDERTIADELKTLGYATGMVGKWHLGRQRQHHPMSRGFDEFFGFLKGANNYIDSRVPGVEEGGERTRSGATQILRGFEEVQVERYLTDVFDDEAVAFIERHPDEPFFLFLSHLAPHGPLQATKPYLDRYRHIENDRTRIYAAMVASLDDSVGRIVEQLKATGQYENTLIVFLSDNGCSSHLDDFCSNAPFSGFKREHHEGGVRVPFILSWPGKIPADKVYEPPVISLDLLATLTAAAGGSTTTEDSVNLLPFLTGTREGLPHEYLYWRSGPTMAIRDQRWKLIRYDRTDFTSADLDSTGRLPPPSEGWDMNSKLGQLTLLYDLLNDPGETENLAGEHPEIVTKLTREFERWAEELPQEQILPPMRSKLGEFDGELVQLFF